MVKLASRFGVRDMLQESNDNRFMVSLLYYFGVLTLTENYTEVGELIFKIPNLVTEQLYVERIRELLLPTGPEQDALYQVARQFYMSGDLGQSVSSLSRTIIPSLIIAIIAGRMN